MSEGRQFVSDSNLLPYSGKVLTIFLSANAWSFFLYPLAPSLEFFRALCDDFFCISIFFSPVIAILAPSIIPLGVLASISSFALLKFFQLDKKVPAYRKYSFLGGFLEYSMLGGLLMQGIFMVFTIFLWK